MRTSLSLRRTLIAAVLWILGAPICSFAANPGTRIDYAISFFPPAGAVILHGGWSEATGWQPSRETWKLDSSGWSLIDATNSPSFAHHSMTYDSNRQVLVMCGMSIGGTNPNHQTWEFNGTQWSRGPDIGVGVDGDVEVAFDALRNETVLYAAPYDSVGGSPETWGYDGFTWMRKLEAHQPLSAGDGALLQYDSVNGLVVLVGATEMGQQTETWVWNGTDWSQINGPQPPHALLGGMTFDTVRGEMVLITTNMQTWSFDGSAWTQRAPAHVPTPAPNGIFSMAFDPLRRAATFHGGESPPLGVDAVYPTKTWEWNGADWAEFAPGTTLPTHAVLENDLSISMENTIVLGGCYSVRLNHYPHPQDSSNLYWVLDLSFLGLGNHCGSDSPQFNVQTFAIYIPAIDVFGTFYTVELGYYVHPADPANFYWRLVSASLK